MNRASRSGEVISLAEQQPPPAGITHGEIAGPEYKARTMPLLEHLQEFRLRLFISLVVVAVTSTVSWFYAGRAVDFLVRPVGKLVFLTPGEAFFTYLRVSVFMGFLLGLPVIAHQAWLFIRPALREKERKLVLFLGPVSMMLFLAGAAFSFYFVLPAAIKYFTGFATAQLQPLFSLGAYISFIISFLLPFGLVFELPLILIVLAKMEIINAAFLESKRKIFVVLAFIIGALAAPTPDIFSQAMVALPLLVFYEVSIFLIKYFLCR